MSFLKGFFLFDVAYFFLINADLRHAIVQILRSLFVADVKIMQINFHNVKKHTFDELHLFWLGVLVVGEYALEMKNTR